MLHLKNHDLNLTLGVSYADYRLRSLAIEHCYLQLWHHQLSFTCQKGEIYLRSTVQYLDFCLEINISLLLTSNWQDKNIVTELHLDAKGLENVSCAQVAMNTGALCYYRRRENGFWRTTSSLYNGHLALGASTETFFTENLIWCDKYLLTSYYYPVLFYVAVKKRNSLSSQLMFLWIMLFQKAQ